MLTRIEQPQQLYFCIQSLIQKNQTNLSNEKFQKISPLIKISKKNPKPHLFDSQSQCPICLQDYDLLKIVPMMICFNQHSTCAKCLSDIYQKRKCPVCCQNLINRADVRKNRLVCYMLQQMFRQNGLILLHSNTYTYKGETKNGKRHGVGEQLTKNGSLIKGRFVQGQITGKCDVLTKTGARFVGEAINGRLEGVFTTKYGSLIEGNFDLQTLSGINCTKKYTNGDIYNGMVSKLKADGFGKLTFANGNTFEGEFSNDYIKEDCTATISGTFQLQINRGQPFIRQVYEQIQNNQSQSEAQQSSQESSNESSEQNV